MCIYNYIHTSMLGGILATWLQLEEGPSVAAYLAVRSPYLDLKRALSLKF